MKSIFLIYIILLLPISSLQSQKNLDDEEQFDDAEFFFASEEFDEAFYIFKQLINKFPENSNLNFRTGMCLLNIEGREKDALPFFQNAVKNTTLIYRERNFDVKKAPYHAWYYLGNAYRINNQLEDALDSYNTFLELENFEEEYNIEIVANEIKACERAKIIKDNPVNLVKENLGELINTGDNISRPVVNINETVMCFMQEQRFYDAILLSYKKDGQWTETVNISSQVGSDGDMIPTAFSADGTEMLLVKRTNSSNGNIYYSKKTDFLWSEAIKLGKNINTFSDEAYASFSPNGNSLIFSSARKGGEGKLDLYISNRLLDGTWGPASNMGSVINSENDETSAFLMKGGSLLYFASDGHYNMGGFDLFFSKTDSKGDWGEPINIGYPLNTTNDNMYYQPVSKSNTGYIALSGEESNFGIKNIYHIEIIPFADPLAPKNPLANKDFTLILKDAGSGEIIEIDYNRKTDNFNINSNMKSNIIWKLKKN